MKTNVLGSYLLTILSGNKRYAHITAIRHDKVNPGLLGMTKIYSEDTVRRAFQDVEKDVCEKWLLHHLEKCYCPFLKEHWILDIDTTVKPLYGHQEGAEIGYNPKKPGRPSHIIHSYMMAETRIILDSEVQPGTHGPSSYSMPRLLEMLDSWSLEEKPSLVRGDCAFGNENVLSTLEERNVDYLFKMKQTKKVKTLIDLVNKKDSKWSNAGQGWEGITSELKLFGWKKARRVVILRRPLKEKKQKSLRRKKEEQNLWLPGFEWAGLQTNYEYSVLVTSLDEQALKNIWDKRADKGKAIQQPMANDEILLGDDGCNKKCPAVCQKDLPEIAQPFDFILSIAQLYRDRATCENNFDELKNQWGWGGFMTQDLLRSQISARIVTLIYNWWSLFTRWVDSSKHREGITSRPLMLHGCARKISHGGKTIIKITHLHAKRKKIQESMFLIQRFLNALKKYTQQILTPLDRWRLILSEIFKGFLGGRILRCDSG